MNKSLFSLLPDSLMCNRINVKVVITVNYMDHLSQQSHIVIILLTELYSHPLTVVLKCNTYSK